MNKEFYKVVNDNLCVGCGLCESIFGSDNISIKLDGKGKYIPVLLRREDLKIKTKIKLEDFCPGLKLVQESKPTNEYEKLIGKYFTSEKGYSNDPEIRFKSSSGGIITSICLFLIEKKYVKGVLHVGANPKDHFL